MEVSNADLLIYWTVLSLLAQARTYTQDLFDFERFPCFISFCLPRIGIIGIINGIIYIFDWFGFYNKIQRFPLRFVSHDQHFDSEFLSLDFESCSLSIDRFRILITIKRAQRSCLGAPISRRLWSGVAPHLPQFSATYVLHHGPLDPTLALC